MAWVKLDDSFPEHPKVQRVGSSGVALFIRSLSYCNRNLTDGFVPELQAKCDEMWSGGSLKAMVDAGLFERSDGGYRIHDYLDYQPSRAQVLAERAAAQQRMKRVRSAEVRPNNDRSFSLPVPVPVPVPKAVPDPEKKVRGRAAPRPAFTRPSLDEVTAYCLERRNGIDPQRFLDRYDASGWMYGNTKIRDWKAAVRTWERNGHDNGPVTAVPTSTSGGVSEAVRAEELTRQAKAARRAGREAEAQDLERKAETYARASRAAQEGGR